MQATSTTLEAHFAPFREQVVGHDLTFETLQGEKPLVYADWIASGRLYAPIEDAMRYRFGPLVGNTHTDSTVTSDAMTRAYHHARQLIKQHVNAGPNDVLLTVGTGMTTVVCKLQRLLGLRGKACGDERPVVFVTHMEHHSNHTSWLETNADVVMVPPGEDGRVDPAQLERCLDAYAGRSVKIGSFTAASNVTGIRTPYHALARVMHAHDGLCFVDFAASAPYDAIDMHPADPDEQLDAIFFSPHKFLGGPGSCGVLVFDRALYPGDTPDVAGGGTATFTTPWGDRAYTADVEAREDGGTPGFLQTIRAALSIRVKEQMGVENIHAREQELLDRAIPRLEAIPGVHVLCAEHRDRIGALSFWSEHLHYNLIVCALNDYHGVQARGGWSCAGPYAHHLFSVDEAGSRRITEGIRGGDLSSKPGWARLSLHPTMTDADLDYVLDAVEDVLARAEHLKTEYTYQPGSNAWARQTTAPAGPDVEAWFEL